MRTVPTNLRPGDTLADGGRVESWPVEHNDYASVVVQYANLETRIRDFDKSTSIDVHRPLISFAPTGQGIPLEDERANLASDAYERHLGL